MVALHSHSQKWNCQESYVGIFYGVSLWKVTRWRCFMWAKVVRGGFDRTELLVYIFYTYILFEAGSCYIPTITMNKLL